MTRGGGGGGGEGGCEERAQGNEVVGEDGDGGGRRECRLDRANTCSLTARAAKTTTAPQHPPSPLLKKVAGWQHLVTLSRGRV